ncbi:MAG TPA: PQQ-binding-like beta-propeller repeat protein [Candidatus Binatia bacterium]|nr:PQQ-binding-like beta-propeller repeat protein [Candidatus Binatia bacterium]
MSKYKTATIILAIFLTISTVASTALIPMATAHTPSWQIPTFAYIQAIPDPIGVGQTTIIYMWLNKLIDGTSLLNNVRFHNYHLTITAPDGTVTTKDFPIVTDPTSNVGYGFAPDQAGTYKLDFSFSGQKYTDYDYVATSAFINDTYLPSSASTTMTVQQEPIFSPQDSPLPTSYWTRPIYGLNSNWYAVSSNWLGTGSPGYYAWSTGTFGGNLGGNGEILNGGDNLIGPLTGHIMWTKPLQDGGIVGGNQSSVLGNSWFEGSAYQQRYGNPIIVNGKLYYTNPVSFSGPSSGATNCVDLQTGQVLWSRTDVPALSHAYVYDVQDPNQHGTYPAILFTSSWRAFDAFTGNPLFNVTNVPSGYRLRGVNGEILIYQLRNYGTTANPNYYLLQWNSSNLWTGQYSGASTSPSVIPPITDGSDSRMYDWNISLPDLKTSATPVAALLFDRIIFFNGTLPSTGDPFMGTLSSTPYTYFAVNINLKTGANGTGTILWRQTLSPPPNNITVLEGGFDPINRIFTEQWRETMQFIGYSMDTGQKVWGPTAGQKALDYYGSPGSGSLAETIAYGKIYSMAYAGILYAYDASNGNLLWTYGNGGLGNSTQGGFEVPGNYPTFINAIGNGVIYMVTTEHTVETPIPKGSLARAVNATTGEEIWTLSDYTGEFLAFSYAIADGYATWFNGYDNQIYVVGRGPSQTTVTTPHAGLAFGQPVVITGSVTDIATGTKQTQVAGNFPNGVPASSDASMREWMGFVYQQQPEPTNFTGVEVQLAVLDANGNHYPIGTATTDPSGTYRFTWTPTIPGDFTVFANFAGTNGYWPSYAEDGFTVMKEPTATVAPTQAPASMADTYILPIGVAIIVVIIVIGAVLALLIVRKRP